MSLWNKSENLVSSILSTVCNHPWYSFCSIWVLLCLLQPHCWVQYFNISALNTFLRKKTHKSFAINCKSPSQSVVSAVRKMNTHTQPLKGTRILFVAFMEIKVNSAVDQHKKTNKQGDSVSCCIYTVSSPKRTQRSTLMPDPCGKKRFFKNSLKNILYRVWRIAC